MIYPWQQTQWQQVRQQFSQGRLPHALLLTGSKGLGKHDFAASLAGLVLCDNPQEQACGQCRQCRLYDHNTHPDFFSLAPQEKSRIIKVDQIRALIQSVAQTPNIAKYQVAIIHPLEALNVKSANAFLKVLEEPMGNVMFVLVADSLGTVPITIVSRCQQLHFYLESNSEAETWLKQSASEAVKPDVLLRLAQGAPLLAKHLSEQDIFSLRNNLLQKLMGISDACENPISNVEKWVKGDIELVLMLFRMLLQDVAKCQLSVSRDKFVNIDCFDQLQKLAQLNNAEQIQTLISKVLDTERTVKSGIHVNPQLALEGLMLSF